MSRREFLKWQAKGACAMAACAGGILMPSGLWADVGCDIGLAKGDPAAATRAAVGLVGGMEAYVKPGDKVVIKPNFSFANPPEMATTTHPLVVSSLVAMCKEAGADRVRVLDHPLNSVELCLQQTGISTACQAIDPNAVHAVVDRRLYAETEISQGKAFRTTDVMKDVLEADVLIAAPVAKSHGSTGVSLSMKGMMGLIWERGIMHYRFDLNEAIVDLCTLLKADLAVIDATRVLTTNGPSGPGKVDILNTVIASPDMVAADAQAVTISTWYGRSFRPNQVKHIKLAAERGLGRLDIENLRVKRVEI